MRCLTFGVETAPPADRFSPPSVDEGEDAFVILLYSDNDWNYILGTLVVTRTLRQLSPNHSVLVLVTPVIKKTTRQAIQVSFLCLHSAVIRMTR